MSISIWRGSQKFEFAKGNMQTDAILHYSFGSWHLLCWLWHSSFKHIWFIFVFFLSPATSAFSVLVLHDRTRVLHVTPLQRCVRRQAKSECSEHIKALSLKKKKMLFNLFNRNIHYLWKLVFTKGIKITKVMWLFIFSTDFFSSQLLVYISQLKKKFSELWDINLWVI